MILQMFESIPIFLTCAQPIPRHPAVLPFLQSSQDRTAPGTAPQTGLLPDLCLSLIQGQSDAVAILPLGEEMTVWISPH